VIDIVPRNVPKEGVAHNLLRVGRAGSESQFRLAGKELLENRDGISWHVDRVERLIGENGVVDFVFVFTAEGRLLEEHLVDEDTKRPPVDRTTVLLIEENLYALVMLFGMPGGNQTSGAINSGVPQKVLVVDPYHISSLHNP